MMLMIMMMINNIPMFLHMLYGYSELPEDDQDRSKHAGATIYCVQKKCNFSVIACVGFIVFEMYVS